MIHEDSCSHLVNDEELPVWSIPVHKATGSPTGLVHSRCIGIGR